MAKTNNLIIIRMLENMDAHEYNEQKVIGNQPLLKLSKTQMLLSPSHRSIGALTFKGRYGKTGKGSAVLISKDLILTAAHNIYDKQYSIGHKDFRFYLAPYGVVQKYYSIKSWRFPVEYLQCTIAENCKYDYALMKLQENAQNPIGYKNFIELSHTCEKCLIQNFDDLKLQIYGYPFHQTLCPNNYRTLDKEQKKIELYQYGLTKSGQVLSIDPKNYKIYYSISTLPGQSGCPVLSYGNILAIHVGSDIANSEYNIGRLLTSEVIQDLQRWCTQLKGNEFTLNLYTLCEHFGKKQLGNTKYSQLPSSMQLNPESKLKNESINSLLTKDSKQFYDFSECSNDLLKENKQEDITKVVQRLLYMGKTYYNEYNYTLALETLFQCLRIKQEIKGKDSVELTEVLNWIGSTYYQQNNFKKAIEYYQKSTRISERHSVNPNHIILFSLACAYKELQNYKEAARYFQLSLRVGEGTRNKSWVKICANQLVICFQMLNQEEKQYALMTRKTI